MLPHGEEWALAWHGHLSEETRTCPPGIQCWKFYNFWIGKVIFFHSALGFTGQLVVQSFIFLAFISSLWHITSELDSETITLFFSSLLSGLAYLHKWRQKWWKLWNIEETLTVGILRSNCFCFCFWGQILGKTHLNPDFLLRGASLAYVYLT